MGSSRFTLASQPQRGAEYRLDVPKIDCGSHLIDFQKEDFTPDPIDTTAPYDAGEEQSVYRGKTLNANQRPLLEIGRPWYQLGQLAPGQTFLGSSNLVSPQLIVFGDFRAAMASNSAGGDNQSLMALESNLNFDLKLTATERFHFFISPLDRDGRNTRYLFDDSRYISEFDPKIEFGFLEGDLGALAGGLTHQTLPFDLPFAVGAMPLVMQNGIWMDDAIIGVAATIPARNSPRWGISNMDTTFFWGFDDIDSPAFEGDDDTGKMYGVANFLDALGGYIEADYAFVEDRNSTRGRSYHNIGLSYSRRYGRFISNSVRFIGNAGQSTDGGANTADGFLISIENSLITGAPSTLVPYCNLFFGSDRPQSAARDPGAGGILRNTGILFEGDGMTGYPTLDASANETCGGAVGVEILARDFSQQLILEAATVQVRGDRASRLAVGDQYGLGVRYQIPVSNAIILRFDGMVGFLEDAPDLRGVRVEVRHKF